jgi:choline dehydrogenase-like flavoprotein
MAVAVGALSDTRRRTLGTACDTFAPSIAVDDGGQMESCRMGSDPADSVADGRSELHDTKGVWISGGSVFPTAPGVNPVTSIMSLAHRTAANMLAASQEVSHGIG